MCIQSKTYVNACLRVRIYEMKVNDIVTLAPGSSLNACFESFKYPEIPIIQMGLKTVWLHRHA